MPRERSEETPFLISTIIPYHFELLSVPLHVLLALAAVQILFTIGTFSFPHILYSSKELGAYGHMCVVREFQDTFVFVVYGSSVQLCCYSMFLSLQFNWRQADFLEEIPPELVEEVTQASKTAEETGDQTTVEQSGGDQTKPSTEGIQAETRTDVDDPNPSELPFNEPESDTPAVTTIDQSELDDKADQSQAKDSSNQSESEAEDQLSLNTSSDQSEGRATTSQSPSKSASDHSVGEHSQASHGESGGAANLEQKSTPPVKKPKPEIVS